MEKNEGLVPDIEHDADFTGFSEDQSNKATEGGVGEIKIVGSNTPQGIVTHKPLVTIFSNKKKRK